MFCVIENVRPVARTLDILSEGGRPRAGLGGCPHPKGGVVAHTVLFRAGAGYRTQISGVLGTCGSGLAWPGKHPQARGPNFFSVLRVARKTVRKVTDRNLKQLDIWPARAAWHDPGQSRFTGLSGRGLTRGPGASIHRRVITFDPSGRRDPVNRRAHKDGWLVFFPANMLTVNRARPIPNRRGGGKAHSRERFGGKAGWDPDVEFFARGGSYGDRQRDRTSYVAEHHSAGAAGGRVVVSTFGRRSVNWVDRWSSTDAAQNPSRHGQGSGTPSRSSPHGPARHLCSICTGEPTSTNAAADAGCSRPGLTPRAAGQNDGGRRVWKHLGPMHGLEFPKRPGRPRPHDPAAITAPRGQPAPNGSGALERPTLSAASSHYLAASLSTGSKWEDAEKTTHYGWWPGLLVTRAVRPVKITFCFGPGSAAASYGQDYIEGFRGDSCCSARASERLASPGFASAEIY